MIGRIIAGRFELDRLAGTGGMGTVYRARDLTTGAYVAVKLLNLADDRSAERFESEATILAELSHPAIVRYLVHGVTESGQRYLIMEWLEGENLATRMDREPLTIAESLFVTRRVAEALAHVHPRGIVHRDIKPENLFLPDGDITRMKVLDFGIARLTGGGRRLTVTGSVVGTPGYIAPEVVCGERDVRPAADIFSLGCVLFQCLSGRPVFESGDTRALMAKLLLQDAPRLREFVPAASPQLDDLLAAMLAKAPGDRLANGAALLAALAKLTVQDGDGPTDWRPRRVSLTATEQRIVCVVMAAPPPTVEQRAIRPASRISRLEIPVATARTGALDKLERLAAQLKNTYGARVQELPDGTLVVSVADAARPSDQAGHAARSALAIRAALPKMRVVVATGPGRLSTWSVMGEVIENGTQLLGATAPGCIRLDEMTAACLDGRFEIHRDELAFYLHAERDLFEHHRNLLGRSTEFVGRGRELSQLTNLFSSVVTESQAAAILVTGPAGVGKSRLRREFLDWVQRQSTRVEVMFASGDSLAAGSPFAMLGQALRRAAGVRDGESIDERRGRLGARVARHVAPESRARITSFLGEIAQVGFPDETLDSLRVARQSPQLMSDGIRRGFEDFLAAECSRSPVLLVLEDLHWGDLGTVTLVEGALRALTERPFMVLALARPDIETTFPALWAERDLQEMRLGPLSRKAAERLVRGALGANASADDIGRIMARADGNAFYLEELVRAHAAGRGGELPDSVLGMVQARLDAEGADAKRVLRAASIFGERFARTGVVALLGGEQEAGAIGDWLDHLCARELITHAPQAEQGTHAEYTFAHALVREAAYALLTEDDRRLGHRLAGDHLEQAGGGEAMILAEHFQRGEEPGRAIRWYERAAEQALSANDLGATIARADLGLGCGAAGERAGTLRSLQAEAHLWRGELAAAEERALEAVALLAPGSATWLRAQGQAVVAAAKRANFDRIEQQVREVMRTVPDFGARNAEIICLAWAANYLIFAGRTALADDLMLTISDLGGDRSELDAQAVALIHQAQAVRNLASGDLAGCLSAFNAALVWFETASDLRNACAVRSNMAYVSAELGDLERAEAALRQALLSADRMGLRDVTAHIRHNLGRVLGLRGRAAEARALEEEAVRNFAAQGDPRLEGVARAYLAEILLAAREPHAAAGEAQTAVELLKVSPSLRVSAMSVLARARLAAGLPDAALAAAREAHAALEQLGEIEEGEALVRLTYAECLSATGAPQEARAVIIAARERLLARAALIGELTWRQRFLRDVPANARTLALAEATDIDAEAPHLRAVR